MPEVRETVKDPIQGALPGVPVTIWLVASSTREAGGFAGAGITIMGRRDLVTDALGAWTANLPANSTLTPTGTYYAVERKPPGRPAVRDYIIVPSGAGPYDIEDILTAAPEAPNLPDVAYLDQDGTFTEDIAFTGTLEIPEYTEATLPAAGTAGRIARVTNNIRGLWRDLGRKWQRFTATTPEEFGAIGDGTLHPLSERYATLSAAQADYSFVTSLTQSIDWAALTAMSTAGGANGGGRMYLRGDYHVGANAWAPDRESHVIGDGANADNWQPGSASRITCDNDLVVLNLDGLKNVKFEHINLRGQTNIWNTWGWTFDTCQLIARSAAQRPYEVFSSFAGRFLNCEVVGRAATGEVQTVTINGATGGTFTLTISNPHDNRTGTTAPIAWNASLAAVQAAIEAAVDANGIPILGGRTAAGTNVVGTNQITVTGTPGVSLQIKFAVLSFNHDMGQFSGVDMPLITADGAALTPSPAATVSVATTTAHTRGLNARHYHNTVGYNGYVVEHIGTHWWHVGIDWTIEAAEGVFRGDYAFIENKAEVYAGRQALIHIIGTLTTGTQAIENVVVTGFHAYDSPGNLGSVVKATIDGGGTVRLRRWVVDRSLSGSSMGSLANASATPNRLQTRACDFMEGAVSYKGTWTAGGYRQRDDFGETWVTDNSTRLVLAKKVSGDLFNREEEYVSGLRQLGTGAAALDTSYGRGGVGFMYMPLLVKTGTTPSDADFVTAPPNGTPAFRSDGAAGSRVWLRVGGVWTAIA